MRTLTGKTLYISLDQDLTVFELKNRVQDREGILPNIQRLIVSGQNLEDARTLSSYNIGDQAIVHLVLGMTGC